MGHPPWTSTDHGLPNPMGVIGGADQRFMRRSAPGWWDRPGKVASGGGGRNQTAGLRYTAERQGAGTAQIGCAEAASQFGTVAPAIFCIIGIHRRLRPKVWFYWMQAGFRLVSGVRMRMVWLVRRVGCHGRPRTGQGSY